MHNGRLDSEHSHRAKGADIIKRGPVAVLGTRKWMAEIGKLGGSVTSAAKAKAAAENGKLGGRPKKATVGV